MCVLYWRTLKYFAKNPYRDSPLCVGSVLWCKDFEIFIDSPVCVCGFCTVVWRLWNFHKSPVCRFCTVVWRLKISHKYHVCGLCIVVCWELEIFQSSLCIDFVLERLTSSWKNPYRDFSPVLGRLIFYGSKSLCWCDKAIKKNVVRGISYINSLYSIPQPIH